MEEAYLGDLSGSACRFGLNGELVITRTSEDQWMRHTTDLMTLEKELAKVKR
jgi:hypothetical protein